MSLLDISLLFFFSVTLIKIAVDFEKHMTDTKPVKYEVRKASSGSIPASVYATQRTMKTVRTIPIRRNPSRVCHKIPKRDVA